MIRVKHMSFGEGEIVDGEIRFGEGRVLSIPDGFANWLIESGLIEISVGKGSIYSYFESKYPNHIIIQKEGFFYTAHGKSADILGGAMDYKISKDDNGISITGGPDLSKIDRVLSGLGIPFIVIENGKASYLD